MGLKVLVYGSTAGFGSYVRVTAGLRQGLAQNDALAGFVSTDEGAEHEAPEHAPDVAVYVGDPIGASVMTRAAPERLLMLYPNSTWLPKSTMAHLERESSVTGYVTASRWGAEIIRRYTQLPVSLWPHGFDPSVFRCDPEKAEERRRRRAAGEPLRLLHVSSAGGFQRKGSYELAEALASMCDWVNTKTLDAIRPPKWISTPFSLHLIGPPSLRAIFTKVPHTWTAAVPEIPYQDCDLVVQPSRAEGFGMVPLEALASGVPVAATTSTGHEEYLTRIFTRADGWHTLRPGFYAILTGINSPIDDGPEGMAPSLTVSNLLNALLGAIDRIDELASGAVAAAPGLVEELSWKVGTAAWLKERSYEGTESLWWRRSCER